MRLAASDFILFCQTPQDNIRVLSEIVPEVEIMIDGDAWDDSGDNWDQQSASVKGSNIPLTVHPPAWDVNPAAPIRTIRLAAQELNRRSAEFAHRVGASQIVFHPGYYDGDCFFSQSRAINRCYESLEDLIGTAKPLGLTIAFENIAGPSSSLFTQEEFPHALDGIDDCVKYLLDVGHAHMNHWNIPGVIETLTPRLCAFHLHDNKGSADSHLPIGSGTIDWESCFSVMRELPEDVLYIMEYAPGTPLSTLSKGSALLREKLD